MIYSSGLFDFHSFERRIDFEPPVLGLMVDDVSVAVEHRKMALIPVHREKISDRKVFVEHSQ